MKRIGGLYIAWLVAAGLLVFAAVERHPYSFYTLLRWICCPVFAYSAFMAYERHRVFWVWVFGVLAALYNPIFRVGLDRSTWIVVNWLTVGAILVAIGFFRASETKVTQHATPKDGEALRSGLTQAEEAELRQLGSMPYNQLTESQNSRWLVLDAKRNQAKADASERHVIIGVVIATLVCFYFSIDAGIRDYKRFNKATGVATGQVVELEEGNDEGGPSRWADYQFKVNGTGYDGWTGNWDESLAKGDAVPIYYNPSDPELNHAKGDGPKDGFFNQWTVFGIFCLIAVFGAVREQRKQSRNLR